MEFCQNCGHKLNPGQKFCPDCGTVQKEKEGTSAPSPEPSRVKEVRQGKPSFFQSKGFKIIAGVIVVLAAGLFGTYKYMASTMTPEKIEVQFIDAVKKQNAAEMKKVLNQKQTELTIDDKAVKDFLAYYKKHPDVFSETIAQLKKDAGSLAVNKNYNNKKAPVSLVRDGKKWLLFDYYAVNVKPYYIKVTTNQSPVEVLINGQSVGKMEEDKATYGPYLLSDFKIEGKYKGKYTPVTATESVDPYEEGSQNLHVDLDVTGDRVEVYSNVGDALLYVNGQNTGKKIKDIEAFGPVPVDGSMKMQAVVQAGSRTMKSNEEVVTEDGQEVDLEIPETDFNSMDYAGDAAYYDNGDAGYSDSSDSDTNAIAQVVNEHYQDISNGNYEDAFQLFSAKRQKQSYSNWKKGVEKNYQNNVTISDVQKVDDHNAVVSFSLTSYDRESSGDTLVQVWGGKWNLINENGRWVLSKPEIKKLDSYTN
ncbi:zinc ribbon domain-containing protein [Neobacillus mesonae]|uniref:zinc ribbon domain-containing protein n=1 Tax=Neobacillus mesonae TaxID=1193713 RepID=UPI00204013E4|nr:zinc-ribbon domain-containing protein [Neobacillus mesonae]MCM3568999.1 zinc-ribbon domain-containing protein [Neobacillus mesonae]